MERYIDEGLANSISTALLVLQDFQLAFLGALKGVSVVVPVATNCVSVSLSEVLLCVEVVFAIEDVVSGTFNVSEVCR